MAKKRTTDKSGSAFDAIVLAAGSSTRFGDRKLLSQLNGKPLMMFALEAAAGSACRRTAVVVNNYVLAEMPVLPPAVEVVLNESALEGIGSSISCGVQSVADSDAVLLLAADQPLVTSRLIDSMLQSGSVHKKSIIAASFRGMIRNPVMFPRMYYPELIALHEDRGARIVAERHAGNIIKVELDDEEQLIDVDTPADLERVRRIMSDRG